MNKQPRYFYWVQVGLYLIVAAIGYWMLPPVQNGIIADFIDGTIAQSLTDKHRLAFAMLIMPLGLAVVTSSIAIINRFQSQAAKPTTP